MTLSVRLLQIADSAFPISGYTHSWGLEAAVAQGLVRDAESLERWTSRWLRCSLGPMEGALVAAGYRRQTENNDPRFHELNELAEAAIVPPSIRQASREMGAQMLALAATWEWSANAIQQHVRAQPLGWHHPVVFGLIGGLANAKLEDVLIAYLHQAVLGIVSAGARVIPVGHTHTQQLLAYLHHEIHSLANELKAHSPDAIGAGCPFYEVLCDEQTRLYSRVFRS